MDDFFVTAEQDGDEIPPQEMIIEASGRDTRGLPKTKVGLFFQIIDNGRTIDKLDVTAFDPIVTINKEFAYVTVDLVFASKENTYLSSMNDLLLSAYSPENSFTDTMQPLVTMVLIPQKYNGKFYMLGSSPVFWALTAQSPRGEIDTLRFVFDDYNFFFLKNDEETIIHTQQEIRNAETEAERQAEYYEKKEAERRAH